jgi:hypothetical protein
MPVKAPQVPTSAKLIQIMIWAIGMLNGVLAWWRNPLQLIRIFKF